MLTRDPGTGLVFLPESPRYFVKRGNIEKATQSLATIRGQPRDSEYVQQELAELVANPEYERQVVPQGSYFSSGLNCFQGSLWKGSSNLRRTILGTSLQMMQQWTGVNFIFYFGTTFFQELGTISNPFLIGLITTLVNVCSTPISFYIIERFGRRAILIWGALGMVICQYIVAIAGTVDGSNPSVVRAEIAFICIYIFFFAATWGPAAWVVIGEIFPLPIRSRAVGLSTASNWLWNCVSGNLPYILASRLANLFSRSSPSSLRTWSAQTRATSGQRSSSSGARSAPSASSTPTSSSLRPRALPWSKLTECWRRPRRGPRPNGYQRRPLRPRWAWMKRVFSTRRLSKMSDAEAQLSRVQRASTITVWPVTCLT